MTVFFTTSFHKKPAKMAKKFSILAGAFCNTAVMASLPFHCTLTVVLDSSP